MTEAEWDACADPDKMLEFLRGKASDRKLRLFAVACCRRVGHLLIDERSRRAVEAAEQFAEGAIDYRTLEGVCSGVNRPRALVRDLLWPEGWLVADAVSFDAAGMATDASADADAYVRERQAQCRLLREMSGNPFRRYSVRPAQLKANKGRVGHLAQSIYDARAFDRLPLLADALEEAGCADADILAHCRGTGEHVRGCWVVDLLLGKT